jgi:hypothetical protein
MVDTFTRWIEEFPTSTEKAKLVTKTFLTHIIPHFGLLSTVQSENGPAFISAVTQQLSQALGIKWTFYIPYRLQSSRKVKRANALLKHQLTKLSLELKLAYSSHLP